MTDEPVAPQGTDDDDEDWPPRPDPHGEMAQWAARFVASRELMHDARTIMRLGPGSYELDLLKGSLRHANRYHPTLIMAGILRARLGGALESLEESWDALTRAALTMQLRLDERDPARGYKPINVFGTYTGIYVLCRLEVTVVLATEQDEWTAFHRGPVDWPRDWDRLGL
jgi:hypothetical protein